MNKFTGHTEMNFAKQDSGATLRENFDQTFLMGLRGHYLADGTGAFNSIYIHYAVIANDPTVDCKSSRLKGMGWRGQWNFVESMNNR